MKILQKGHLPPPIIKTYRGECDICHCKIEAEHHEVQDWGVKVVKCPTDGCRHNIVMKEYITRD